MFSPQIYPCDHSNISVRSVHIYDRSLSSFFASLAKGKKKNHVVDTCLAVNIAFSSSIQLSIRYFFEIRILHFTMLQIRIHKNDDKYYTLNHVKITLIHDISIYDF